MNEMKALIWREMRVLRRPALIGFAVAAALGLLITWRAVLSAQDVAVMLFVAWAVLTPIVALLLGCNAIAQESARGEVQFGRSLPVSAPMIWWAKLLATFATLVAFAVALALAYLLLFMPAPADGATGTLGILLDLTPLPVAIALSLLGIGLLLSTVAHSPFNALVSALIALILAGVFGYFFFVHILQRWGPHIGFWPIDPMAGIDGYIPASVVLLIALLAASYIGFTRTRPLQTGRRFLVTLAWGVALTVLAMVLLPVGQWAFGEPTVTDIPAIVWAQTNPDGSKVAFTDDVREGGWSRASRLWVMRSDGSDLNLVSRRPVRPRWSQWEHPRWLPFRWGDYWGHEWLWVWDAELNRTRKVRHLALDHPGDTSLSVSPDGRQVIGGAILSLEDPAVEPIPLPERARFVAWGQERAYVTVSNGGLQMWSVALRDGSTEPIATAPPDGPAESVYVSPDERWIVWSDHYATPEAPNLIVTDMRGRVVASLIEEHPMRPDPWSLDGRYLWVGHQHRREARVLNAAEEFALRPVAIPEGWWISGNDVQWSPDGRRCAFSAIDAQTGPSRMRVYSAHADGTDVTLVAEYAASQSVPRNRPVPFGWDDKGRVLVREGRRRIVALDPDSGAREVVFDVKQGNPVRLLETAGDD